MNARIPERSAVDVERPQPSAGDASRFGSDAITDMLRALGVEYVALTPGASFRGLHDSLVNHLGNARPAMLLALHEESAVAIAHGYARVTGRPMAVALHANVGLMHATMAIFNAWCDRVPMLLLGGVGPMDAVQRRPWVDWIHTARDLGALVRGYTKWDDQPASVEAALEALLRAWQITQTSPKAPVYVCLDASIQEEPLARDVARLPLDRFPLPTPPAPSPDAVAAAARALSQAARPVILVGRVSTDRDDWRCRVELAERLHARVVTDWKTGASFPTQHALHPYPPGMFIGVEAAAMVRDADAILSLDWIDLAGTLKVAGDGTWPRATIIHCSLDAYCHNGYSMDYQSLPPADVHMLASPDLLVRALLDVLPLHPTLAMPADVATRENAAPSANTSARAGAGIPIETMAEITVETLAAHAPSYIRLPIGWPGRFSRFADPLDYIGFDGGGGIGSGPGMAVGAALALAQRDPSPQPSPRVAGRGSDTDRAWRDVDRLPVAVLGDGDYLMGVTALWTAVHYRVPLLVIVANNQSFFNDELHQERVARTREREVANRWIGMRMSDPELDLARLAQGQGATGFGPVTTTDDYAKALASAIDAVKAGAVCVIDVHVAPEYARAVSSALLRKPPPPSK
jgi:thiamine pyrophosphate-dependent acetolactate synthase large subunit-like protein